LICISPSFHFLADLGLTEDWLQARLKILASIPNSVQKTTHDISNRFHVDSIEWSYPEKNDSLKILQQAIWEEKELLIKYEGVDSGETNRVVNPLGLVAKGSKWYLIAVSNGKFRNYRVSRIKSISIFKETFLRLDDFDLAEYWSKSTKEFVQALIKYEVKVEISSLSIVQ
jgi:predicted DNA-binding transcriptional regulator YafY